MDPEDLLPRHREHPERIGVAQVVLAGEGEARQVVDGRDVARLDVRQALAVERDALLHVRHEPPKAVGLQRAELVARERLQLGLEDHVPSLSAGSTTEIELSISETIASRGPSRHSSLP